LAVRLLGARALSKCPEVLSNMSAISALLVAVFLATPAAPAADGPCVKKSLGQGVTLAETTAAADLLAHPQTFAGRPVRVEGEVVAVCEMAGCWLELRAAGEGRTVRVKVDDGAIVFPVAARGRRAVAQGTVEVSELDRDAYLRRLQHEADEQGTTFDPASIGAGPFQTVEIHGTGAEVCW
jgi:hypothetical protein